MERTPQWRFSAGGRRRLLPLLATSIAALACFGTLLVTRGCDRGPARPSLQQRLVGTWRGDVANHLVTMSLASDGTFAVRGTPRSWWDSINIGEWWASGTWKLVDEKLVLTCDRGNTSRIWSWVPRDQVEALALVKVSERQLNLRTSKGEPCELTRQ
jgi:hypothetical protein